MWCEFWAALSKIDCRAIILSNISRYGVPLLSFTDHLSLTRVSNTRHSAYDESVDCFGGGGADKEVSSVLSTWNRFLSFFTSANDLSLDTLEEIFIFPFWIFDEFINA